MDHQPTFRRNTMNDAYVALTATSDSDTEPKPYVFTSLDAATGWARRFANENGMEVAERGSTDGLFWARNPDTRHSVWVVQATAVEAENV
jgi:hypothetical protein